MEILTTWLDVTLISLLAALPLALWAKTVFWRKWSNSSQRLLGGVLLGGTVVASAGALDASGGSSVGRTMLGIGLMTGLVLVLCPDIRRESPLQSGSAQIASGLLALFLAIVPPALYAQARNQHELARLTELVEQSRWGEANHLAKQILIENPAAIWKGLPLEPASQQLSQTVQELQATLAQSISAGHSVNARYEQAQILAMLGETEAALAVLNSLATVDHIPATMNLTATIHETRQEWSEARAWYQQARQELLQAGAEGQNSPEYLRATQGVAYCSRKQGLLPEAQAAYRELLALSPTADTHFLLAQFYEDTQQTRLAESHARIAMRSDPQRYQQAGQKLIQRLQTLHFGCLAVSRGDQPN